MSFIIPVHISNLFENSSHRIVAIANYVVIAVLKCRSVCDPQPSPLGYLKNEHVCGRPLGLRFNKKTGDLYIADAYFGLMKVGPEGGVATSLATAAEGVPFTFTNDLDIDDDGNVYFTDSSSQYQRRSVIIASTF